MATLQETQRQLESFFGKPITVTSGYRSPSHPESRKNPGSAHTKGYALDFLVPGMSTTEAARKLAGSGFSFDQLIDEGDHVHYSTDPRGRGMLLTGTDGKFVSGIKGFLGIGKDSGSSSSSGGGGGSGGIVGSVLKSAGITDAAGGSGATSGDVSDLVGETADVAGKFAQNMAVSGGNPLVAAGMTAAQMMGDTAGDIWQKIVEAVKTIFDNIVKRIAEALEPWISRGAVGILGLLLIAGALIIFAAQSGVVEKVATVAAKAAL